MVTNNFILLNTTLEGYLLAYIFNIYKRSPPMASSSLVLDDTLKIIFMVWKSKPNYLI